MCSDDSKSQNSELAKRIPAHYDRHVRAWDADRRAAQWNDRLWIERFVSLLQPGSNVLDLGCGGGDPVAAHMAASGMHVTGVDGSPTLISLYCARLPGHDWIVANMCSQDLGRRFDGVLAWDSYFHLRPCDQRSMFAVFRAHAKLGAILMFNTGPAFGEAIGEYRGNPLYHASLDASEYRELLASDGFEIVEHAVGDPRVGGRIVWIARCSQ
jgi:SAM-dependent methyltransferase